MKFLFFLAFLVASVAAQAQQVRGCSAGNGSYRQEVAGYIAQIAPASEPAQGSECHGSITRSDGKSVLEVDGHEVALNPVSGMDVNGGGKPDAVLETHPARGACCFNYYVVTLGDAPGLLRQFQTSVPLTFEDKLGDGKVEIWTHDFAFDGVDGFTHAQSPQPLIFFRLRGSTIYDVSTLFWPEYERDINDARGGLSKEDLDDLTKAEGDNAKPPDDEKAAKLEAARAGVLTIALDYLYGGRGADAWKTINDMWPPLDHQRIRELILRQRMRGILGEINRLPKNSAQQSALSTQ
jgi:hypothetical protein